MKLLTATRDHQDERDGDFCHAVEGELVLLGLVCADDERDPDSDCGCGRAFTGMSSMRATTTAVVRELDVSPDDVRLAIEGYYVSAGMGPDLIGTAESADLVAATLDEMVEMAGALPVGVVVRRRLDDLIWRSEPSGVWKG